MSVIIQEAGSGLLIRWWLKDPRNNKKGKNSNAQILFRFLLVLHLSDKSPGKPPSPRGKGHRHVNYCGSFGRHSPAGA